MNYPEKPRQGMPWLRGEATGLPGLRTANLQRGASRGRNPPPSSGWGMSTSRARIALVHRASPGQPCAGSVGNGMCGDAGPRETIPGVPQQVPGEMRRPAHCSPHAHTWPADGYRAITGDNRVFLCRGDLKTEPSGCRTHMSIGSGSSESSFSTYAHCHTR